jgi:archaellum component FlaC
MNEEMRMNQLWATQQHKLEEKDTEIERLKADVELLAQNEIYHKSLLTRAADSLEGLVNDLRKAAL